MAWRFPRDNNCPECWNMGRNLQTQGRRDPLGKNKKHVKDMMTWKYHHFQGEASGSGYLHFMEKVTRKLTVQAGQVAKSHTTKDTVCDNKQLVKNLSLRVASISTSVVSLKLSLLGTDCLHYTTTTLGCHTVSKKPTVVNWFLSVLFLPCTFSHP